MYSSRALRCTKLDQCIIPPSFGNLPVSNDCTCTKPLACKQDGGVSAFVKPASQPARQAGNLSQDSEQDVLVLHSLKMAACPQYCKEQHEQHVLLPDLVSGQGALVGDPKHDRSLSSMSVKVRTSGQARCLENLD